MISAQMFSAQMMLCSPKDACRSSNRLLERALEHGGFADVGGNPGGGGAVWGCDCGRLTAVRNTRRAESSGMCSALNLGTRAQQRFSGMSTEHDGDRLDMHTGRVRCRAKQGRTG